MSNKKVHTSENCDKTIFFKIVVNVLYFLGISRQNNLHKTKRSLSVTSNNNEHYSDYCEQIVTCRHSPRNTKRPLDYLLLFLFYFLQTAILFCYCLQSFYETGFKVGGTVATTNRHDRHNITINMSTELFLHNTVTANGVKKLN